MLGIHAAINIFFFARTLASLDPNKKHNKSLLHPVLGHYSLFGYDERFPNLIVFQELRTWMLYAELFEAIRVHLETTCEFRVEVI